MKNQIDALATAVRSSLARSANDPYIKAILVEYSMDGLSWAIEQRAALERIAADELHVSAEDRAYAVEVLDGLPTF
jgi:hypothetical protein